VDPRVALLSVGAGLLAVGGVLSVPAAIFKSTRLWRRASRWSAIVGMLGCAAAAAIEWWGLSRPPALSLSESLTLLAPALALGYLFIEGLSKSREGGAPILLGAAGSALLAAMTVAAAGPLYPDPAPPELAGALLPTYAAVTFLALGLLGAAGLQAATFLVVERLSPARGERAGRGAFWAVCLGLPPLIWSLLAEALWAQQVRGDLWVWNAREVWGLVLVLLMAAYICLRHVGHWPERRAAWLLAVSIVAWATVLVHAPATGF
jgi:ABC-type transport system involved in cytochrome c biogenesis permease subunit